MFLLVEVADSSLLFDRRTKLPVYARHRVPEVWIVNLQKAQLEIYREPKDAAHGAGGAYSEKRIAKSGEAVSIQAFPAISFAVSELIIQAR